MKKNIENKKREPSKEELKNKLEALKEETTSLKDEIEPLIKEEGLTKEVREKIKKYFKKSEKHADVVNELLNKIN